MIDVEDWAEIRRLHRAEGLSIKAIVRRLGVARNTVRDALRSSEPPRYERAPTGSAVDAVEPQIRELLREFPAMPATVIAERIGWERGITILQDRVAELRPLFVPPDPCQRTSYAPGELAQWDLWQPDVEIPLGFGQADKLWVVVGRDRVLAAASAGWMVPSRAAHDVLGGMLHVLDQFGAVPRTAVWDQRAASASGDRAVRCSPREFQAFRGTLGMGVRLCAPRDPEAKGWSNAPTAISRRASCRAAGSTTSTTSTASSPVGCGGRTIASTARPGGGHRRRSARTAAR